MASPKLGRDRRREKLDIGEVRNSSLLDIGEVLTLCEIDPWLAVSS